MNMTRQRFIKAWRNVCLPAVAALTVLLGSAGCEWDDDDDFDHDPPDGQGSLIVDNRTADDIRIYLDGNQVDTVSDFKDKTFDLQPGEYRLVLDERGGDRGIARDIDILEGRLTIVEVTIDFDSSRRYDLSIEYD